jgi:hypothetical protein
MTYLAALTICSPPAENESVISPHNKAKAGRAVPIPRAAIVPTAISI